MPTSMKPFPVVGPFKGLITDIPSGFDAQAFDLFHNVLYRKGRIVSRPQLNPYAPTPPDGRIIRALYSFLDVLNNWHTLVLTDSTAYFLTNPSGTLVFNALTLPAGLVNLGTSALPYALIEMNQQVYFSNGAQPLMFVDGSAAVQLAGNAPGSCQFLTENSSHLIGVSWTVPSPGIVGSQFKPFLVIISAAGDPQDWVPSLSNSATELNLIEKGGVPTGAQTLGNYTYIWRQFGANVLWPTGNSAAPFYNEPFSWSNPGWGNFYPYTLCTWNQIGLMVTHNGEVLLFNGSAGPSASAFQPLAGGKIRKTLAADLLLASGDQVFAFVTDQWGPGYDLEAYVIWIPGLNKAYVLNLGEMTWSTLSSVSQYATAFGNIKVH